MALLEDVTKLARIPALNTTTWPQIYTLLQLTRNSSLVWSQINYM